MSNNAIVLNEGLETCTDDFWYDLSRGGYIKPDEMMEDKEMARNIKAAVKLILAFEDACKEQIEGFEM